VLITLICAILVTALPSIRRRFKWPFELFWSVHHSFIALDILSVAHTIDNVARGSGLASRSQCGLWLIPPMHKRVQQQLLYTFDRWWQNHTTKRTYLKSVKLLGKPKALVVRLARPNGWRYNCGQYARINVPAVSRSEWHPFRSVRGIGGLDCCSAVSQLTMLTTEFSVVRRVARSTSRPDEASPHLFLYCTPAASLAPPIRAMWSFVYRSGARWLD
jgi:hypothetical protein